MRRTRTPPKRRCTMRCWSIPAPRRVLLIGGGVNGSIAEALKHPTVERIDYVELDPALIDMARQFFPAQYAPLGLRPAGPYALRGWPALSEDDWRPVRRDHSECSRSADRADEPLLYRRVLSFRPRPPCAGRTARLELRSSEETISPDLADFLRCIQRTLRRFSRTLPPFPATRSTSSRRRAPTF